MTEDKLPWVKNNSIKPFPNLHIKNAIVRWQEDTHSCKRGRTIYWIEDDDKYINRIVAGGSCR